MTTGMLALINIIWGQIHAKRASKDYGQYSYDLTNRYNDKIKKYDINIE